MQSAIQMGKKQQPTTYYLLLFTKDLLYLIHFYLCPLLILLSVLFSNVKVTKVLLISLKCLSCNILVILYYHSNILHYNNIFIMNKQQHYHSTNTMPLPHFNYILEADYMTSHVDLKYCVPHGYGCKLSTGPARVSVMYL